MFVDNPVGAGFSYVDTEDAYTTDVEQVATDLLILLAQFLEVNPEFKVTLEHYSHLIIHANAAHHTNSHHIEPNTNDVAYIGGSVPCKYSSDQPC